MNPQYNEVASRAGHRCEYCRAPEVAFNLPFEVEHIVPSSKGGGDGMLNLALSCRSCNLYKSNFAEAHDLDTSQRVALFHPRNDLWIEHFSLDEKGSVLGKTAIGRATIQCLRINSERQISARNQWLQMNLLP